MSSMEERGLGICLVLAAAFFLWKIEYANEKLSISNAIWKTSSAKATNQSLLNSKSGTPEKLMKERLDLKSEVCKRLATNTDVQTVRKKNKWYQPILMYSKKYNVSYCGVGKSGGTFLRQLFSIFMLGENVSHLLENATRIRTHLVTGRFDVKFNTRAWRHSRMITVGRNPYTRLFSAYIDKVFKPSLHRPIKQFSDCKFNVNFDYFLKIVINSTREGRMDPHWSPIYHICSTCQVVSTFIVKQESYTDDLKFVMGSLNLTNELRDAVNRKLERPTVFASVTGITKGFIHTVRKTFIQPGCIGWLAGIKRLWKSFQIEGFIDENVDLPVRVFNKTEIYPDEKLLLDTIINTIQKYPLSSEEAKAQRHRALVRAYSEVDSQTIQDIWRLFEPDFKMFGYSPKPPV